MGWTSLSPIKPRTRITCVAPTSARQLLAIGKFDVAYELYGDLAYGLGNQTEEAFDNVASRLKPGGAL
jgi:hypothetical protein